MTLRYDKTASPCAAAQILAPMLQNKMWHDGLRWHSLDESGQWCSGRHANHLRVLAEAVRHLPDHPFWDRTKLRTRVYGSASYQTLKWMEMACLRHMIVQPAALNKPYRLPRISDPSPCLCGPHQDCPYPPIPEDAR
jgi:hypothetical protein